MGVGGQRRTLAVSPAAKRPARSQPEFDPRTVEPVASRYTDCALPAHVKPGSTYSNHQTWRFSPRWDELYLYTEWKQTGQLLWLDYKVTPAVYMHATHLVPCNICS
jgi:hypothetical protein